MASLYSEASLYQLLDGWRGGIYMSPGAMQALVDWDETPEDVRLALLDAIDDRRPPVEVQAAPLRPVEVRYLQDRGLMPKTAPRVSRLRIPLSRPRERQAAGGRRSGGSRASPVPLSGSDDDPPLARLKRAIARTLRGAR